MLLMPEYNILEKINLNSKKFLYRAERVRDGQRVILKINENINSKTDEIAGIANEYEIATTFSIEGVAHYIKVENFNNQTIGVIADIEGVTMDKYLREYKRTIRNSLKIGISISKTLESLHQKGIIHKDLCPAHLFINPHTLQTTLIDFSFASPISSPNQIKHLPLLNGSLAYTSPELTGRIKGEIDIRSDLYSLGIILYELLTGSLPFIEKEPLALIHCHIAKSPVPPHIGNPEVPVVVSQIILKLLSKNPGDRYQSPFGLSADLQTCLDHLNVRGEIEFFLPGQHDFSGKLENPKQLYGRGNEMETLQKALKSVATGEVEIVLVEGYSGIGKSTLVHQLRNEINQQGGIFLGGKFNQFQRNTPYYAFIQALIELTDYILMQNSDNIAVWKEQILNSVGINGRLLTDIIPHLESLIGHQPPVTELEPNETQNRFNYVFASFIKQISQKTHPLVIFFDDLQWSDAASLNLLRVITADKELRHFLFIGAYRSNEINTNSIFSATLEAMMKEGVRIQKIILAPLPYNNVEEIISEILYDRVQEKQALVSLVYNKSQGNPFFINAFLKCLYTESILAFNFEKSEWEWDNLKISRLKFAEDIVELMIGRIQKLPDATQQLLEYAACLGYYFDLHLLTIVLKQTSDEIIEKLKPALEEGLVLLSGELDYRFTHDRIQQAAYSLIEPSMKKQVHLNIGKSLLQSLDTERRNTYIFEIVNQFNWGLESIISQEEKDQLAALNLTAGIKAKTSAAYRSSFEYLQIGISLVNSDLWKNHYEIALQLYTEGAESGFLSGNNTLMKEWIEVVMQNASTVLDEVKVYEIKIKWYTAQHRLLDAVQTSLEILELLDVRFPQNPKKIHVLFALLQIKLALKGRSEEMVIDLPLMKNGNAEAAIRVLVSVGSAVYFASPNLLPLFATKAFYLMIKHGNSPYSGVVGIGYALIIIAGFGDLKEGCRLGKISVQLSEKFEVSSLKCQSRMMYNSYVAHIKDHTKNSLEPLYNNYWYGLENGNIEFAAYSAYIYCYSCFFCGRNLKEVNEENHKFYERLQHLQHESAFNMHRIFTQAVLNLYETVEDPSVLIGKVLDEDEIMSSYKEDKTAICILYLYKLILSFLFEKNIEALQYARETNSRIQALAGSSQVMLFYFYDTLNKITLLPGYVGSRKNLLNQIKRNLKIFKKFVQVAPMNCYHKELLIKAELCRVTGKEEEACVLYDMAIDEAKKNEYLNDLALTCELAGNYYQSLKREFLAEHYILHACKFYQQWGAFGKVRHMQQKYAYIFKKQELENSASGLQLYSGEVDSSVEHSAPENTLQELDLYSIMKAATAISSEIELDKILKKLVRIAIENAGAKHGYLILKKETDFFIEAEGSIDTEEEVIVQSIPLKGNKSISEAIVQFVYVTKENLVIDNAIEHPHFSLESVIIEKASKSILCTPIIHQRDVIGLLYFENDLITDAFRQDRIEVIRLLSGQMAISLQNALNEQKKIDALREQEKLLREINLHQQELFKTRLEIQEQTYHNISEELHDNIGQALTLIKLNINTIDINDPEIAGKKLFESKSLLTKVIQDLRDLAKTLNTDFIDKVGLVGAIDQQLQFLRRTGLYSIKLLVNGDIANYGPHRELLLFRIVQELLNNIVKHAEATIIEIVIQYEAEKLMITVHDNGKGFDHSHHQLSNNGLGLLNMQNRIRLIKGAIYFESEPQKGTTVTIELTK